MSRDDRYQNQVWWVRAWRRRWYLVIPFAWLRMFWHCIILDNWFDDGFKDSKPRRMKLCWSICVGSAQGKMKWYFTPDEVKAHMEKRK